MAMDLLKSYNGSAFVTFQSRVCAAVAYSAQSVFVEAQGGNSLAVYQARKRLAYAVAQNPDAFTVEFSRLVATDPTVAARFQAAADATAGNTATTDAEILAAVAAVWNLAAGA